MLEDQLIKAAIGLAFIIPAIILVRWLLHRLGQSPDDFVNEHMEILKRKYANGEITEAEYRRRMEDFLSD